MEKLFLEYMDLNCDLAQSSKKHYAGAINTISKEMTEEGIISKNLYDVTSYSEFLKMKELIENNAKFLQKDQRGGRMYSVALYHYSNFLRCK